jgi:dCMP deaminase
MSRPNWDEHALILAYGATCRSPDPYVKVGACALDTHNNVLGVAYNGLAPGKEVSQDFWDDRDKRRPFVLHAETNLLSRIQIGRVHTIASTLLPCSSCARAIAAHKIKRVIYSEYYERDTEGIEILKFYDIELIRIPKLRIVNFIKTAYEIH